MLGEKQNVLQELRREREDELDSSRMLQVCNAAHHYDFAVSRY